MKGVYVKRERNTRRSFSEQVEKVALIRSSGKSVAQVMLESAYGSMHGTDSRSHTGGGADCPVHGGRNGGYGYGGYSRSAYTPPPVHTPPVPNRRASYASSRSSGGGGGGRSSSSRSRRSAVTYSASEYRTLNPVHEQVVRIAQTDTERRDLFLCHAWDDREGAALDFYNLMA